MKSLLSSSRNTAEVLEATSWIPGDFCSQPRHDPGEVEAIQGIFQADPGLPLAIVGRKGVNKANPALPVAGWKPGELKYQQFAPARILRKNFTSDRPNSGAPNADYSASLTVPRIQENDFILAEAKMKAADILSRALASAEDTTQKAYQEGIEKARSELDSTLTAANTLIDQLQAMEDEILANSESQVLDLVKDIARAMFGEGVSLDGRVLHQTFTQALASARSLGNLKIYLNPKDTLNLDPNWREDQAYISGQKMQFIPSEDIKPGGCYVIGEQGSVDARIETKLASILKVLTHVEDANR